MRVSLLSICLLLLAGATVAGAQPAGKKGGAPAGPAKAPANADNSDEDAARAAKEGPASDASQKAGKKSAKGPGLKVDAGDDAEMLKTLSYMQGYGMGKQLLEQFNDQGIELDEQILFSAFKDGFSRKELKMTDEAMNQAIPLIQKLMVRRRAAHNKQAGDAFLAANAKKEGVKTLASGLQYKVLKSGKGETPKKSDTVKAHYKGTFLNGTEFDSSYKRGSPTPFQVSGVIKGWTEALQLMKVGDKWQLFVPAELAYQEKGFLDPQGQEIIPPNTTLVFEIELLGIEKGGKSAPTSK